MESNENITNFFGLVTKLCECLLDKSALNKNNPKHEWFINKLRKKAFEILLKKHYTSNDINDNKYDNETLDPTADLLKHAFVLRSTFNLGSKANKLEDAMDKLLDESTLPNALLSCILKFLCSLKTYETPEKNDLNIFFYGERNPLLPEPSIGANNAPGYQIYPTSACTLSYKIDDDNNNNNRNNLIDLSTMKLDASFSFSGQLYKNIVANNSKKLIEFQSTNPMLMSSTNNYLFGDANINIKNDDNEQQKAIECQSITSNDESIKYEKIDNIIFNSSIDDKDVKEYRTWEMLGCSNDYKIKKFILESNNAIEHLENYKNLSIISSSSYKKIYNNRNNNINKIIKMNEFMENMKLVLLGIESDCFLWNNNIGYIFKQNTIVYGISNESIKDICTDITYWSTCFKLLNNLVNSNPELINELHNDGLILKAMCNNISNILLHYQAGIIQVFNESNELLNLLLKLQPLGELISQVGKLCKCDKIINNNNNNNNNDTTLGEGTGILSHIYKQVTKITKPNIALVYYSILKSCCEIYFKMLEKWIFEGACDETHGEFMIKIRSQYLRYRGYKFWSKCFGIHRESVPGFLDNLCDTILRCGKAVRLLKICDPKNKLCHLFTTSRPNVKVCLNINMLLRQEEICQNYMNKGIDILGNNYTIKNALDKLKINEKNKIKQVANAQQGYLERIKKLKIEKKLLLAKNKAELLAELKYQAEAAITKKEKIKEAKILEDKLWMEKAANEEEEEKNLRIAEAKQNIEFYKELAIEANNRKLRATWRATRMSLFDKRLDKIISERQDELLLQLNDNDNDNIINSPDDIIIIDNPILNLNQNNIIYETIIKQRPTDLPIKLTTEKTINKTTEISEILDEISESNRRLTIMENKHTKNNQIIQDAATKDDDVKNDKDEQNMDNIIDKSNDDIINNMTKLVVNDLNDFTPMSCTTDVDSYIQSNIGSYCGDNKNDFESPLTPGDYLIKQNYLPTSQSFISGIGFDNNNNNNNNNSININNTTTTTTFDSSLTMADVELIDNASLQICLKKSVIIPLMVQSNLANSAIIKYLLQEHNILSHLQSLRSFFFLLNGEFSKNLSSLLFKKFYEITMPIELFNSATLTNLLENALHSSLNFSYKNSDLLTLSVIEVPTRLQVSNPEALDCLCLNYKISWPLNLIIDELSMQQYSKVFKFLLMVGRVQWVLQEDFCLLKIHKKSTMSSQYHKVQLYRHAMMQFMTAFSNYLTCSVLHASWQEFEKDLETSTTLDDIYSTHVMYINKIRSRCILTSKAKKLRDCIINIFKIILKFHNCLRSHDWHLYKNEYVHSNYIQLEKMYNAFCELRTYPAIVVEKLADSGYQSHLIHFLDALNINPLYNLSTNTPLNN